jgi:hypothetical protein
MIASATLAEGSFREAAQQVFLGSGAGLETADLILLPLVFVAVGAAAYEAASTLVALIRAAELLRPQPVVLRRPTPRASRRS